MAKRNPDRKTPEQLREQIETLKSDLDKVAVWRSANGKIEVNLAKWTFDRRKKIAGITAVERAAIEEQHSLYKSLQGQLGPLQRQLNNAEDEATDEAVHVLDAHKPQLLEWFGRYTAAAEVHRRVVTDLNLRDVSYAVVLRFAERNGDLIKEQQRALRADLSDLGLTHKRGRLEVLHRLATDAELNHRITGLREDHKLLLQTLEQIRKEVEGDQINVSLEGKIEVDVQATIRGHIATQLMQDINPLFIVVSRIAAQRGLNPLVLMTALQTSYYARLNGFQNPNARIGDSADFLYPSQQPMDWNAIEAMHTGPNAANGGMLALPPGASQAPAAPGATGPLGGAPVRKPTLQEIIAARLGTPPEHEEEA